MALNYKPNEVKVDFFSYRHMLVGTPKAGKTTMFADLVKTLYKGDMSKGLLISVGSESGYSAIQGLYAINAPTYADYMEIIDDLCENKEDNNFAVIAIDTADELVTITEKEVCRRSKLESGNKCTINGAFGGYGAGRKMVAQLIDDSLARLNRAGYGTFIISHTKEKTVKEKNGDSEYQQLGVALSNDYSAIFTNKSDIIAMLDTSREIDANKRISNTTRWLYFRSNGYYNCGCRFPDIVEKCEFSVDNYIEAVEDAIKASLKGKADDKYIAEKKQQEQAEKEAYYQEHKEELSSEEAFDEANNAIEEKVSGADSLISEINNIMKNLSQADRDNKKAALASANLPASPAAIKKLKNVDTLNQILNIVKA